MKTNRFTLLFTAMAVTALVTTGCAKEAETPAPSTPAAPAPAPAPAPTPAPVPVPADAAANWTVVRNYNYDRHSEVLASLPGLEAKVDQQVTELEAERAALPATTDKKDWDFAMKEMAEARVYLKSASAELTKAEAETWDQQRDKVDQAWTRTQDAYRKVKAGTTNR